MTKFYSQKYKITSGIHLNIWKHNVCSIKRDANVLCLHKIQAMKIALLLVKRFAVHDF